MPPVRFITKYGCFLSTLLWVSVNIFSSGQLKEAVPVPLPLNNTELERCLNNSQMLTVFIKSKIDNFDKRNFIRESWGSNLRCVFFLLGYSPNETINQLAQTEMALNQDILQIPIIDEYSHLTEKGLFLLKMLASRILDRESVFLYGDDDILIQTEYLIDIFSPTLLSYLSPLPLIIGYVWVDPTVERSGKNAVSPEEYKFDRYPSFCGGLAYFMTKSAVLNIVKSYSDGQDYLWLDDVFITGILAKKAGVHLIDWKHLYSHEMNYKAYNASVRYKEGQGEQTLEEYLIYGPSSIARLYSTWHWIQEMNKINYRKRRRKHLHERQKLLYRVSKYSQLS